MVKKIFLNLLCFGLVLGFITGCDKSSDDSKKYDINISADKNIEVKTYIDYDKDYLIVYLTNNNDYNIGSFDINANFYDENGNRVGEDSSTFLDFMSGGNYAFTLDLPEDEEYNKYIPKKTDITVKIDQEYQEVVGSDKLYNDKISTNYNKLDDEVKINLKNNSGVELSTVEIAVLFMKNGKPVYAEGLGGFMDIDESITESIDIPENWEASEKADKDILIDFDSIEIVINRAS